jgi:hypothetical protein
MPQLEYKVLSFNLYDESITKRKDCSSVRPNVPSLVEDMNQTLNKMAAEGWRVVSVNSVLHGVYKETGSKGFGGYEGDMAIA